MAADTLQPRLRREQRAPTWRGEEVLPERSIQLTSGAVQCLIEVSPPAVGPRSYIFEYDVFRSMKSWTDAAVRIRNSFRGAPLRADRRRFGFVATNFDIPHRALWDSVYPLLHLTRQGGPVFGQNCDRLEIRLKYDVVPHVVDFFQRRATHLGIDLTVDATGEAAAARLEPPSCDTVALAFGGGKDSRLLLGLLRDFDLAPDPFQSGFPIGFDVDDLLVSEAVSFGLVDHVMPGLMHAGKAFYFGSGIGEAHRTSPWHRHFDFGSPRALAELSQLFPDDPIEFHAPLAVLPYNLIQKILADRYPRLYAFQHSVVPNEATEKNLHVALCRLYHGLDPTDSCSERRFSELLDGFVAHQLTEPMNFGYRDYRMPIRLEMRSIIHRLRSHPLMRTVAPAIPEEWGGDWIDYIHPYVSPGLSGDFLAVFRQYADEIPSDGFRFEV